MSSFIRLQVAHLRRLCLIIFALQHFHMGHHMFTNSSFEAIAKTMTVNAEKFNPAASQEMFKPVMENLKVWAELAQNRRNRLSLKQSNHSKASKSRKPLLRP
jgi:hypothetical protein